MMLCSSTKIFSIIGTYRKQTTECKLGEKAAEIQSNNVVWLLPSAFSERLQEKINSEKNESICMKKMKVNRDRNLGL